MVEVKVDDNEIILKTAYGFLGLWLIIYERAPVENYHEVTVMFKIGNYELFRFNYKRYDQQNKPWSWLGVLRKYLHDFIFILACAIQFFKPMGATDIDAFLLMMAAYWLLDLQTRRLRDR